MPWSQQTARQLDVYCLTYYNDLYFDAIKCMASFVCIERETAYWSGTVSCNQYELPLSPEKVTHRRSNGIFHQEEQIQEKHFFTESSKADIWIAISISVTGLCGPSKHSNFSTLVSSDWPYRKSAIGQRQELCQLCNLNGSSCRLASSGVSLSDRHGCGMHY